MSHIENIPNVADLNDELMSLSAPKRVELLYERWGDQMVASTSFGLQSGVMLKLISEHAPTMPVIFVDTGYLFPETYEYMEALLKRFPVNLKVYTPNETAARQEAVYGKLWTQGEEGIKRYAFINKVEPMNRALEELKSSFWLSGLRRAQSSSRLDRQVVEAQKQTTKVYPIIDWVDAKIASFYYENDIPKHPLESKGYVTMGDWHSTKTLKEANGDIEATRHNGAKYECGLHEVSEHQDFQI